MPQLIGSHICKIFERNQYLWDSNICRIFVGMIHILAWSRVCAPKSMSVTLSQLIGCRRQTTWLNSVSVCLTLSSIYLYCTLIHSSCYQSLSLATIKSYQFNGNTHLKQRGTQISDTKMSGCQYINLKCFPIHQRLLLSTENKQKI